MRIALGLLVVALGAAPARADLRAAIDNDTFTDLDPPIDDSGFTNDIAVAFWRPLRGYDIGGTLFDRWITEVGGPRRWDQLELAGTAARTWTTWVSQLVAAARLGPVFAGNFGGRRMQDRFHALTKLGNTLDEGLQDTYPDGRRIGAFAGLRGRATYGTWLRAYAGLDGQVAVGQTGITMIEATAGGEVVGPLAGFQIGMHAEVAGSRFHTTDANLAIPGGYGVDSWEGAVRFGAHVSRGRIRIDYEYRSNEGGSGEPIGVVAVTIRQHAER